MTSITTLSTELLIQIFRLWISSYYVPAPRTVWRVVSGSYSATALSNLLMVCHRWRAIVLSNPSLWSVLDLRSDARVTKMLEMSEQAPLIVRSRYMPQGNIPDEQWSRRVRSIVDDHSSRIEELNLTGPFYSICKSLEAAGTNMSLLRSFRLVGTISDLRIPSSSLPLAVQKWVAPQLEELVLDQIGISWKSALLQSCHHHLLHLDISIESEQMSPLHHATQLSHMKRLRTLSIRGDLRFVTTEQFHSVPIRLSNLTYLTIKGSKFECRKMWDMLELPRGCKVSLHCIYSHPSGAINELLPSMEKFLCCGRDRGEFVQHIEMTGHISGFQCRFWMERPPNYHSRLPNSKPFLSVHFRKKLVHRNDAMAVLQLLIPFLASHIIPHLRSLHLSALPGLRAVDGSQFNWPRLLGGATELTSLIFEDSYLRYITTLLSSTTVHNSTDGSPYTLAALERLELTGMRAVDYSSNRTREQDDDEFQTLKQCLHARGQSHVGPRVLSITGYCDWMNSGRQEELKEVVPMVIWEPAAREEFNM